MFVQLTRWTCSIRFLFFFVGCLLFSLGTSLPSFAQAPPKAGLEFWGAFQPNRDREPRNNPHFRLSIQAARSSRCEVEIVGSNWTRTVVVIENTNTWLDIPYEIALPPNGPPRAIHITASDSIQVEAFHFLNFSSEGSTWLPAAALGNEYCLLSWLSPDEPTQVSRHHDQFTIVASGNNTEIEVVPTYSLRDGNPANQPIRKTLQAGETWYLSASEDLTGSRIRVLNGTCKTVAVFSGASWSWVGGCHNGNHLYEQQLPLRLLGKSYFSFPYPGRDAYWVRCLALENGTEIRSNDSPPINLQAGENTIIRAEKALHIWGNHNFAAIEMSLGSLCENADVGDPSVVQLPPENLAGPARMFFAPLSAGDVELVSHVILFCPDESRNEIQIQGDYRASDWQSVHNGWSWNRYRIGPVGMTVISTGPVLGYSVSQSGQDAFASAPLHRLFPLPKRIQHANPVCAHTSIEFQVTDNTSEVHRWFVDGNFMGEGVNLSRTFRTNGNYSITALRADAGGCWWDTLRSQLTINSPRLQIDSSQNPTCFGREDGWLQGKALDGSPPYRLEGAPSNWNEAGRVSDLGTGRWFLYVVDGKGCRSDTSVLRLEQPSALQFTVDSVFGTSCFGTADGRLYVSPDNFEYSIDGRNWLRGPVFAGLLGGERTIQARNARGCKSEEQTVQITEPPAITNQIEIENTSCFESRNGKININSSGGTGPYRYRLTGVISGLLLSGVSNNRLDNLPADRYVLLTTDSRNCQRTDNDLLLSEPQELVLTTTEILSPSCTDTMGGSVMLRANGGTPPYFYRKNEGDRQTSERFTGLAAGEYRYSVIDSKSCESSLKAQIFPAELFVLSAFQAQNTQCRGDSSGSLSFQLAGGTPPFEWYLNEEKLNIEGRTGKFINLAAGEYRVHIRDASGCEWDTLGIRIGTELSGMQIEIDFREPLCPEVSTGALLIRALGGRSPYRYFQEDKEINGHTWIKKLSAGQFPFLVRDASGCIADTLFELKARSGLQIEELNISPATCFNASDGSIFIKIKTEAPPLKLYFLNEETANGSLFSNLSPGEYRWYARDSAGCVLQSRTEISSPPALRFILVEVQNPLCFDTGDGQVVAKVAGGTPPVLLYLNEQASGNGIWEGLQRGEYLIKAIDSLGCETNQEIKLLTPPALQLIGRPTAPTCKGLSDGKLELIAFGGVPPYRIGLLGQDSAAGTFTTNHLVSGQYPAILRDSIGCRLQDTFYIPTGTIVDAGPPLTICIPETDARLYKVPLTTGKPGGGIWTGMGITPEGVLTIDPFRPWGTRTVGYRFGTCVDTLQILISGARVQDSLKICPKISSILLEEPNPLGGIWIAKNGIRFEGNTAIVNNWRASTGWLIYRSAIGCLDSTYTSRYSVVPPSTYFDPAPLSGKLIELTLDQAKLKMSTNPKGLRDLRWSIDGTNFSRTSEYNWTFGKIGSYPVELAYETDDGCLDTLHWTVRVLPAGKLDIPNAFSPDGDGLNDVWTFEVLETDVCILHIFDRWGTRVHEQEARIPRWDGKTQNGEVVPEGVFVYYMELRLLNGDIIKQGGTITVVR